eukprot:CAMPEP_0203678102 /NCGR_PEP_ID=MMETSP0090-20130426/30720_1 /ASSEMBLY_ACC=CAM_ASM_001088 /TAXON_ID=426623 /ORGANISM="Chaetoceros affinis, Strain CCMP159" /LENGTH=63 /DNA_ID=CAMNT_0050545201 /DNA_START=40 /DNA_END=231 /DNA_ORIENTATION=+
MDKEVENLISNLKAINRLEINEEKFHSINMKNEGSVDAVVVIWNDILNGNRNASSDRIFRSSL